MGRTHNRNKNWPRTIIPSFALLFTTIHRRHYFEKHRLLCFKCHENLTKSHTMFLLRVTLSSHGIPSCESSTHFWKHRDMRKCCRRLLLHAHISRLLCRFPSKTKAHQSPALGVMKYLTMTANICIWLVLLPQGRLLAWAAPLKYSIWLHIFPKKHRQWWFPFPDSLGGILHNLRYRLEIHSQMESVYRNQTHIHVCRQHQIQLLCLTQTLENANTAAPDLGYRN